MTDDIVAENQRLVSELRHLTAHAVENQDKLQRLQTMELQLVGAHTLVDLLRLLVFGYGELFSLSTVTLTLADPEYEIQRALEAGSADLKLRRRVIFVTGSREIGELAGMSAKPWVGAFDADRHGGHFLDAHPLPESVAIVPLYRHGGVIGLLNLGSTDAERFREGDGTDFLERLAAVATICIVNHVNQRRAKERALVDPVTGLNTRAFLDQRVAEEVSRAQRTDAAVSALFFGFDGLQEVNDRYGHRAGDTALRELSALVAEGERYVDVLGRFGSDQLVLLLTNTAEEEATKVADRLRARIAAHRINIPGREPLAVTASIGVATLKPEGGADAARAQGERLVERARQAMQSAKSGGRDQVAVARLAE